MAFTLVMPGSGAEGTPLAEEDNHFFGFAFIEFEIVTSSPVVNVLELGADAVPFQKH